MGVLQEVGAVCEQTIRTDARSPPIIRGDRQPGTMLCDMSETPETRANDPGPSLATAPG